VNSPYPKPPRATTIAEKISDNEPYRRYMQDPRYAMIVKMLTSEMIDGWFDSTQLSEAVQLATRRHREYVAVHGQRDARSEMELELHRRLHEEPTRVSEWRKHLAEVEAEIAAEAAAKKS
jgi:hypothetical protein